MNDPLQPDHCAELLSALAAPERLKIVRYLRDGEKNVTEIVTMLEIPSVNVAHHLTVLLQAKLVQRRKQGRFVFYSLPPGVFQDDDSGEVGYVNLGCCRLEIPKPDGE